MKIFVSNIGSTSFKFRLFDISGEDERELASGGADRISQTGGTCSISIPNRERIEREKDFSDHGQSIIFILDELSNAGVINSAKGLDAVAFKAILAGDSQPVEMITDDLLERMEYFAPIAPAHNPPYVAAMRMFGKVLGDTPMVAAFEVGFHASIPDRRKFYAVPMEWADKYGVRKYGYHGASHRWIAVRTKELTDGRAKKIISCHLGGSSSLCAIRDGKSVATSMGLSPQSGLPQSNRAGEFDPFAMSLLGREAGMNLDECLVALGGASGLEAISGIVGGDMRDIRAAAKKGNSRAKLARELFITAVRDYLGAYLVELAGADAIVFTGGIGQHDFALRQAVCENLEFAGIRIDTKKNAEARDEQRFDSDGSSAELWVVPTNEELIVARQAKALLMDK